MGKCICGEEMLKSDCCKLKKLKINNRVYDRNTSYFDYNKRCHDCNILNKKGNAHHVGCDMERCPKCKQQLISCGCDVEEFWE